MPFLRAHVFCLPSLFVLTCDLAWGPQESRALGRGCRSGSLFRALIPETGEGTLERNRRRESQHRIMSSSFTAAARASEGRDKVALVHGSLLPLVKGCPGVPSLCITQFAHREC